MHKKKLIIFIIFLLVVIPLNWRLLNCANQRRILEDNFQGLSSFPEDPYSPSGKYVILMNDTNSVIYDLENEKNVVKFSHDDDLKWAINNELVVTNRDCQRKFFKTIISRNFKKYKLIDIEKHSEDPRLIKYFSNTYNRCLVKDKKTKEFRIKYENGSLWDIPLKFNSHGLGWSNNEKFLEIDTEQDQTYLVDVENRKVILLDKFFESHWAPTASICTFYTDEDSRGFPKDNYYLFNPVKLEYIRLKKPATNLKPSHNDIHWSPDSRYLIIVTLEKIYLYDIKNRVYTSRQLVAIKNANIDEESIHWSKDHQFVQFRYSRTTWNVFKPFDYFVARVNLHTGKVKSIYVDGLLYKTFKWVNDRTIVYEIDHLPGLYKSDLWW